MSSSTDNDAANTTTRDKDGDLPLAAGQLALQIEDLSIIEEEEGDRPSAKASTNSADNGITCAACGKEGEEDSMNICNKCKMVHYCNVACKKKHKSKHKKKCDRQCKIRAVQLHDEALFKQPPLPEDCPICMLPLPLKEGEVQFQSCCGKLLCIGCVLAMVERGGGKLCAFCRTPDLNSAKECIKRIKLLMEKGNGDAYYQLAGCYAQGELGMPQDRPKSNELLLKAGELGCTEAYNKLGNAYYYGDGVEIDKKKAMHYFELAAMNGNVKARYWLGFFEVQAGNYQRACKHFILAAKVGHEGSLERVKAGFMDGFVTKDEYESTLRAYYERQTEMKSEERDKAAADV